MKFFKKNASMQQTEVKQPRRFSLGQYIAAVSVMLVSVTALSYAAGILKLNSFQSQQVISAQAVNDNFDYVQTNLNVIAASMVSAASDVQASNLTINASISNAVATAAADATTKANNAQAASLALFTGTNQSKAINGYQRLAGGLIIQWGYVTIASNGTVNYPIAFPTAVAVVNVTGVAVGANPFGVVGNQTTSNFLLTSNTAGSFGFNWIAIGY